MSGGQSQGASTPERVTFQLPHPNYLARSRGERLWKGLERFANCPNSPEEVQALGKAFPGFWPVDIHCWITENEGRFREDVQAPLAWHPVASKLFLFYRDALRRLWCRQRSSSLAGAPGFLLGIDNSWHEQARDSAECAARGWTNEVACPRPLVDAWATILGEFPNAQVGSETAFVVRWPYGDFCISPRNDFQRAFYLLFRQSWRAKVCPRCNMFFIARRPKQLFCGTGCSAGSRLASKRKWWKKHGPEWRRTRRPKKSKRKRGK